MRIAITGHRPEDLSNLEWIAVALEEAFRRFSPEVIYQGCAAGVDLMAGKIAIDLGIPVISVRPWAGHSPRNSDKELYDFVTSNSETFVVDPSEKFLGPWQYHKRNHYMVDRADVIIAVWTGKTTGGTAEAVKYAKKNKKSTYQIDPQQKTADWFYQPEPEPEAPLMLF